MKLNKKYLLVIICFSVLLIFLDVSEAAGGQAGEKSFLDTKNHWAAENITRLAGEGVVEGYPDGTFKPDKAVTRAEFCVMLGRSLQAVKDGCISEEVKIYNDFNITMRALFDFDDRQDVPKWAVNYIGSFVEGGVIDPENDYEKKEGWPVYFKPQEPITRLEVAGMAGRVLSDYDAFRDMEEGFEKYELHMDFKDDEDIRKSSWNIGVACALGKGLIAGYPDGNFRPEGSITRAEAATVLARLMGISEPVSTKKPKVWSWETNSYKDITWEKFIKLWSR